MAVIIVIGVAVSSEPVKSTPSDTSAFDPSQDNADDDPPANEDSTDDDLDEELEAEPEPEPKNKDEGTVVLIVKSTGSDRASVTYVRPDTDSFQMSQDTSANLPWRKTFHDVYDLPMGFNMNAQQSGDGTLTCIVKQDGKVIARNSSQGNYSVVSCAP